MSLPPIKKHSPSLNQHPSIRLKQEPIDSYLQTLFTAPKHRRGVHWEKNIPKSCSRDARDVDRARKDFTRNLVRQLAEENKAALTARWLADGVITLDWIYDVRASERFQPKTKEELHSINSNGLRSMGGIDYLDLTLHDIPYQQPLLTQQTENLLSHSAIGVDADQREAYGQPHERSGRDKFVHHSIHTPIVVDLVIGDALCMHNNEYTSDQMDIDTTGVPSCLDLQIIPTLTSDDPYLHLPGLAPDGRIYETVTMYPSPPRNASRPRSRLDRLARIGNGTENEGSEESSSEESTSSTECHPTPVHPISGGGEWSIPFDFFPFQVFPSPSDEISPSAHLSTHAAGRTPSASRPARGVKSLRRANLVSSRSSVVRERFGTGLKKGAKKEPLPCSLQQPNTEEPRTGPTLPTQYHLIEDMPIVLPRAPCATNRARRLLLPSHESRPIAWVSMIGDAHWVDPERRFWKRDWSANAIKDEDFCVGDACRLDDETLIQAHLKGSHIFSVVTEPGCNTQPTRRHLVSVPAASQPGVTSIAAVSPTTFITGGQDRLIQLWCFRRKDERPAIGNPERLSMAHTSAIRSIAMGRDNVLWSAAGNELLGTDIRDSRTIVPLTRKANARINQLHFNEGELLLETSDLDHPFRLYDPRSSLDLPIALFGVTDRKSPTAFQRGGWINNFFAHGLTTKDKKEHVVLWDLRNTEGPLQTIQLRDHTGMHCAFYKGGRDLIVTGNHHISFFTL